MFKKMFTFKQVAGFLVLWFLLGFFGRSMFKYHFVTTYGEKTWLLQTDERPNNRWMVAGPVYFLGSVLAIIVQDHPRWGMTFDFRAEKILTWEEAKKLKQEQDLKKFKKGKCKKDFRLIPC